MLLHLLTYHACADFGVPRFYCTAFACWKSRMWCSANSSLTIPALASTSWLTIPDNTSLGLNVVADNNDSTHWGIERSYHIPAFRQKRLREASIPSEASNQHPITSAQTVVSPQMIRAQAQKIAETVSLCIFYLNWCAV